MAIEIYYNGERFHSISEVANKLGLKEATIKCRLKKGLSIEEALAPVTKHTCPTPKEVVYKGKPYRSKNLLCKKLGIPRSSLNKLMSRGMSLNKAVKHLLDEAKKEKVVYYVDDTPYSTISSIAKAFCISSYSARIALVNNRTTSEVLIKIRNKVNTSAKPITYKGKDYPTLKSLASDYGISYDIFKHRLGYGWSFEDALTREVDKNWRYHMGWQQKASAQ